MLKLAHLVEDKIHAGPTGPFSLVHPAAAGRQGAVRRPALRRDEVWALERTAPRMFLQEILTVQVGRHRGSRQGCTSDRQGRQHARSRHPGVIQVLVKELEGLALGVES